MQLNPIGSNQTVVSMPNGNRILFSYQTPVAANVGNEVFRTDKAWSKTTSRHINAWLDGVKAITKPQAWFDALV